MVSRRARLVAIALAIGVVWGCTAARGLLGKPSPHELYSAKLREAGVDQTALGREWLTAADRSLRNAVPIATPFRETGYFPPAEAGAVGYRLELQRGRRLSIDITFETSAPAQLFVDLFHLADDGPKHVASLDTTSSSLIADIDRDGSYVVRLQPELLRGGRFTITERTLASLRFPISGLTTRTVKSLFGAERDAGARRHQGIDIFAAKGTPVAAVTSGVARSGTNPLGGNVVWLHDPSGRRTFYYAHLDRSAIDGMSLVREGEVLGYVGNTGNARATPPHLHFGLYQGGAVNPLPFLQPDDVAPPNVAGIEQLGMLVRTRSARVPLRAGPERDSPRLAMLPRFALARVLGATSTWLRVSLPDDSLGYVPADAFTVANTPLRREQLGFPLALRERPTESAPIVASLDRDAAVEVLGSFSTFELLRAANGRIGWVNARLSRTAVTE
jgi:peptidoglycan LD-endopeptidase LytH